MSKHEQQQGLVSELDTAVGSVVSWISGKHSVTRGRGATDGALGELLSWITARRRTTR